MTRGPINQGAVVAIARPDLLLPIHEGRQVELFPLDTIVEFPDCTGTADAWGRVQASDTHMYLVKTDERGKYVRASEWVGTRLAEELNMPCPTPKIVQLSDGQIGFGSRIVSGIADAIVTSQILTSVTVGTGAAPIPGLRSLLSALFAYDMFTNNVDRHDENYVSVDDSGTRRFFAIDFGRSLFWGGKLTGFPSSHHPTRATFKQISGRHGFDMPAAIAMINRLGAVAPELIMSIMSTMPREWLEQTARDEFVDWWKGDERQERLNKLREGLEDGSLL
jgi:hypothetical protein